MDNQVTPDMAIRKSAPLNGGNSMREDTLELILVLANIGVILFTGEVDGMVIEEAQGTEGLEESPSKFNTPLYS